MKFGAVPLAEAGGAILAHGIRAPGVDFRKGRRLSAEDLEALARAGIERVTVARLEPGDLHEDEAAARLGAALARAGIRAAPAATGRVNLHAEADGLFLVDAEAVHRFNGVDEGITLATLPPFSRVARRDMVATVKIIPFAVPERALASCLALLEGRPPFSLAPFRPFGARLVQTRLPGTPDKLLAKTARVTRERVERLGGALLSENRCSHEPEALAAAIAAARSQGFDLLLLAGASAITDRRDVVPAAIEAAGGRIRHFGMPVDPGNLLLLAELDGRPVLGLPGCCRSPRRNGLDWVLERLVAGIAVTPEDIVRMGVGGLLAEIPDRPQPREARPPAAEPRVAALVLAAGRSRRMGGPNKLLLEIGGKPMVRHVVEALLASRARPVVVVTGHEGDRVAAALAHLPVEIVTNPRHAEGLSTSLRAGLDALPEEVDGVLVCLADMPRITAPLIDRLIATFDPARGRAIVVPTCGGKRGNPVLFGRAFFASMREIAGDVGARHLLGSFADQLVEVETGDPAVLLDLDTPESFRAETERA
ncbi:MAG TPA: 4-diphosphocytidyl-2C-methyl-D-erythritol kinase [Rhodospirillales bacterium]|nr:4-diphosphocytidyl-2C-methyl-D-erythritol kinase [Rhodospirillales bacterium]